jgi:hypothetical protein
MLVEEFRASPLPPPPDPALDVFTDSIVLPGGPAGAVRAVPGAGRAMGAAASDVRKIFQVFRNTSRVRDAEGEDPYVVRPGQAPAEIEVTLDDGAEEMLAVRPDEPGGQAHGARPIPVALELVQAPPGDPIVVARIDTHRVGVVGGPDGEALAELVRDARRHGRTVIVLGIFGRQPTRLRLYPYGPPRP